jgi:hypothetical protein
MTVSIFDFHFVFLVFVAVEELVVFRLAFCRPVVLWTMLYTIHGRNELPLRLLRASFYAVRTVFYRVQCIYKYSAHLNFTMIFGKKNYFQE